MKLKILGTRGVPAKHGGFETFAEHFSLYLTSKGWDVTVYCQKDGEGGIYEDDWKGVRRVNIPVNAKGAKSTIIFDWISTRHASRESDQIILTLGYNTALFCLIYRLKGIKNIINMDGIEWQRDKWTFWERAWLFINEKLGAWLGNHLIADHPEIKKHLSAFTSPGKITVIPYSADIIDSADDSLIKGLALEPLEYCLVIARPEPENSILEVVKAYSRKQRGRPLVILGNYTPIEIEYHRKVMDAAGEEIKFVGGLYSKPLVQALRYYTRLYIHGHTVGGTNPSLVEALGAGNAVLAHNNRFNRWVAGEGATFFGNEENCADKLDELMVSDKLIESMKIHSRKQMLSKFTWDKIHDAYEELLLKYQ